MVADALKLAERLEREDGLSVESRSHSLEQFRHRSTLDQVTRRSGHQRLANRLRAAVHGQHGHAHLPMAGPDGAQQPLAIAQGDAQLPELAKQFVADPHTCLREVERVLIAEGQVCIMGINPWSFWGRRLLRQGAQPAADGLGAGEGSTTGQLIAPHRLRDWLQLLGFEVQCQRFAGWTPTWRSERWVQHWSWLDALGQHWCPILGGVYLMVATKRVPAGRLLSGRTWRKVPSRSAVAAPVASAGASTHQAPVRAQPHPESLP